ncbi:MAG: exonuclease subunit SbcD, partial [Bacteriovoracaceae bacterium]|nr:exonuclease subunit SbcD [Bacteriovoracaceae bacterium]
MGKRLYRKDREQEHLLFLQWLVGYLKQEQADVLVIAGDIFDSPTPPHSSLKHYYDFLKEVNDLGIHTVVISGNHDSQGLIAAPKNLLKDNKTHLYSRLETELDRNICKLEINEQKLWIKCLPYFRNYELIKLAQELELFDEELPREDIFKKVLKHFFDFWPEGESPSSRMLLSHHVFGDYAATGSEHFIGLSGIESVSIDWLKGNVDYAALGHIHQFQTLSKEPMAVYTGSPIQMRFSERKQKHV